MHTVGHTVSLLNHQHLYRIYDRGGYGMFVSLSPKVESWLKEHKIQHQLSIIEDRSIPSPGMKISQYPKVVSDIVFNNEEDAILFKLTWL
jgi:hypothetical protein